MILKKFPLPSNQIDSKKTGRKRMIKEYSFNTSIKKHGVLTERPRHTLRMLIKVALYLMFLCDAIAAAHVLSKLLVISL